jgi:hypothetical protein
MVSEINLQETKGHTEVNLYHWETDIRNCFSMWLDFSIQFVAVHMSM